MKKEDKFGRGIVYLDGKFVSNEDAKISVFDMAICGGDTVQDFTRTFNGKLFKLDVHLKRLFRSLKVARIKSPLDPSEMKQVTMKVLEKNVGFLGKNQDGWIIHFISSGVYPRWRKPGINYADSTIAIFFQRIHFEKHGKYYCTT